MITDLFSRSFFLFAPSDGHPSSSPSLSTFLPLSPPRKVLCSVEQSAQHSSWGRAVSGWISPQSSGRKFLPKISVKKGQIRPTTRFGFRQRGLLAKGPFQKNPFSRDSRELRDSRETPDCGKQRRIRPFLEVLENLEIDASSEKTPFVMIPFSGPEFPRRAPDYSSNLCPPKI